MSRIWVRPASRKTVAQQPAQPGQTAQPAQTARPALQTAQPAPTALAAAARVPERQIRAYSRVSSLSGIVFATLMLVALFLVRQAPGLGVPDSVYTAFYQGKDHALVTLGLYVVPFAGIAFLWYMSATRALLAARSAALPEIPRLLQLVSGVVWICMMFAGAAAVGSVALLHAFSVDPLPSVDMARVLSSTGYGLVFIHGVRVAGMYMITTTSMARKCGLLPRWLAVLGYLAAVFLLVSTTFHPVILLVFPAWVVVVSLVMSLQANRPLRPIPE